ncbi:MAG: hypothetical protein Q8O89_01570 [Nanoarchaeota archaeon]|nr:hypothetical protein [Nanoarchaeota archaeon]
MKTKLDVKNDMPKGMRILKIFYIILAVIYAMTGLFIIRVASHSPPLQYSLFSLNGFLGLVFGSIMNLIFMVFCLISITMKLKWGYYVNISFWAFMFVIEPIAHLVFNNLDVTSIIIMALEIAVAPLAIVYLYKNKKYFSK